MKSLPRPSIWMFVCLLFWATISVQAFAQTGEIVVATRKLRMETSSASPKISGEAQPGERWEVVKRDKKKVQIVIGPQDERRLLDQLKGKVLKFELTAEAFAAAFVTIAEWPAAKLRLSSELRQRFPDLSDEQAGKIIDGEYWIGMKLAHAAVIAGTRVLARRISEMEIGTAEVWLVAAFSVGMTAETTHIIHVNDDADATPSIPRVSLEDMIDHYPPGAVRIVLTFRDGVLTAITRL
jgi:hypothetical protein